jgi:hypothetical protein
MKICSKCKLFEDGFHVDHKIPITWFFEDTPIYIINHLDNLQLLPSIDNLSKLNRYCHIVSNDFLQLAKNYINPKYLIVL